MQKLTFEEIEHAFKIRGVELISKDYVNAKTPLYFKCKKCNNPHHITWSDFKSNYNPNFLCSNCRSGAKPSITSIKSIVEAAGAELLTKEYINAHQKIYFKCSKCGEVHYTTWNSYKNGKNANFYCSNCSKGKSLKPNGSYGHIGSRRTLMDAQWFIFVKNFFNISSDEFSAHHIKPFRKYSELRTSLLNGFPIRKEYHSAGFIEPIFNVKNPFHTLNSFEDIANYPNYVRLPFHTYKNFNFLDLNKFFITEILACEETLPQNYFFNLKKNYAEQHIFYIPIFFEELFIDQKAQIIYSMLRNRLWKIFPDIYKYTGQEFNQYYARNLKFCEISSKEAMEFFNLTHIQGFIGAEYYFGLKTKSGELISAMSFGKSRFNKNYEYELLRFSNKLNSFVAGGAQKLFKHSLGIIKPNSLISYCDVRFSSINPEDTIYPKLGFEYIGYSKPSYKYIDTETNRLYSRMQFQKHKLEAKLKNYDASLSEAENMFNNGYIKQYDCGNFVFGMRL